MVTETGHKSFGNVSIAENMALSLYCRNLLSRGLGNALLCVVKKLGASPCLVGRKKFLSVQQ
jgi:hypothetical protein